MTGLWSGVRWNYLASAVALVAQVAYTALTARIVAPTGFGAYAAAQVAFNLAAYFTLTTLGNAVLRERALTRSLIGTATVLACSGGVVVGAILVALAPAWAHAWRTPGAIPVIRLAGLACLFLPLAALMTALLRARGRYRAAALSELAGTLVGMASGAVAAAALHSASALMLGQCVGAAALVVIAGWLARADLAVQLDRGVARYLLRFAVQVSGQNLVYFAVYSAPAWYVARRFDPSTLGLYSRANLVFVLPATHLSVGLTKAMYPLYASAGSPEARRAIVRRGVLALTSFAWPAFALVAGAAPIVVAVLLGPDWAAVARMMPPIALFAAVNVAFTVVGNPLEVSGNLGPAWRLQLLWVSTLGGALALCFAAHLDVVTSLYVVAGVQVAAHLVQIRIVTHRELADLGDLRSLYRRGAVFGGACFLAGWASSVATDGRATPERLAVLAAVCVLLFWTLLRAEGFTVRSALQAAAGRTGGDAALTTGGAGL